MSIVHALKRRIPAALRLPLRRLKRVVCGFRTASPLYADRLEAELESFTAIEHVHDLPPIHSYWANKYLIPLLQPFGFGSSIELFRLYIAQVCSQKPAEVCRVLSIGSGDAASEINVAQWLMENEIHNFKFECMDINAEVLARGRDSAAEKRLADRFEFAVFDVNAWNPPGNYHVILAIQCLHHFLELELLFDKIYHALHPDGFFMTDDMIGRNGHQRWPEALKFVRAFWKELPAQYKYNHQTGRIEDPYENGDCSIDGFEGIRAQDILPLLSKRFHFDTFIGFGNIIDIFVDRGFGPNFDPNREWDRNFIDRIHATDIRELESGRLKPTHMYAAMTRSPVEHVKVHKHLTPEFCIRPRDSFPRLRQLLGVG